MHRRTLLTGAGALAVAPAVVPAARAQGAKTKIVFWHAMGGANGDQINRITQQFNASQNTVELQSIFKGSYPDTMNAGIAAWRAGQAPHIVQVFYVGTGSMLAAGPAVKQAWQLVKDTGVKIDFGAYIPSVKAYYSLADGRLPSMPFNSSTPVMWYNKDAFEAAGLDPEKPPATWQEVVSMARTLKDKWASKSQDRMAVTTSWFTWIQLENFSAEHNLPFASEDDGYKGLGAVLEINNAGQVKQMQRLLDMAKEGTFKYGGRDALPDPLFFTDKAAISFGSSAGRGDIVRNAKFKFGVAELPYDPTIIKAPNNTIVGGASLWTMTAPHRTEAEYKAVAEFYRFLGTPEQDALWAENTGYVPVTFAGFKFAEKGGYYTKNPGADMASKSLVRGHLTVNSKGLRLGRLPEIRNIIYEEIEKALQGQQNAKQAMDNAVKRGNVVLRGFQRSVQG